MRPLKKQSPRPNGFLLVQAMFLTLVILVLTSLTMFIIKDRISAVKAESRAAGRTGLANKFNSYIQDPLVLNQNIFDQTCLNQNLQAAGNPALLVGPDCLRHTINAISKDTTSPDPLDQDYYPIEITSPLDSTKRIFGTRLNPVPYNSNGEICNTTTGNCTLQAYAMYKMTTTTENGQTKNAVKIRYKIESLRNPDKPNEVLVKAYDGESTLALEKFNSRSDSVQYGACKDASGATEPGKITASVKYSPTATNSEEGKCSVALGARICPPNTWHIGLNALGDPICDGIKKSCPQGFIQTGYKIMGSGIEPKCVKADCTNDPANPGRFGFLAPKSTDDLDNKGYGCTIVKPKASCANKLKTGIDNSGLLNCT